MPDPLTGMISFEFNAQGRRFQSTWNRFFMRLEYAIGELHLDSHIDARNILKHYGASNETLYETIESCYVAIFFERKTTAANKRRPIC